MKLTILHCPTQIRLFDTATLNCTAILSGHSDAVLAMDARPLGPADGGAGTDAGASADTTLLVSAAKDRSIRLWSAPSGRCLGAARSWRGLHFLNPATIDPLHHSIHRAE